MNTRREIDRLIAVELFGWRCLPNKNLVASTGYPPGIPPGHNELRSVPNYSSDVAAAWLVEVYVKESELTETYAARLLEEVVEGDKSLPPFNHTEFSRQTCWLIAHATPLQRCRAAVKAFGLGEKETEAGEKRDEG